MYQPKEQVFMLHGLLKILKQTLLAVGQGCQLVHLLARPAPQGYA